MADTATEQTAATPEAIRAKLHDARLQMAKADPAFADMRDEDFAILYHRKKYSDRPLLPFLQALGYDIRSTLDYYAFPEKAPNKQVFDALQEYMTDNEAKFPDETGQVLNDVYSHKPTVDMTEGVLRSLAEGLGFGWSDEAVAQLQTALQTMDPKLGDFDPTTGKNQYGLTRDQLYQSNYANSARRREQFAKDQPFIAGATELGGGLTTSLLTTGGMFPYAGPVGQAALAGIEGGIYGAGKGEGDAGQRTLEGIAAVPMNALFGYGGAKLADILRPAIRPNEATIEAAGRLKKAGIDEFTAGQMTGDTRLLAREGKVADLTDKLFKQREQFTKSVLDRLGLQPTKAEIKKGARPYTSLDASTINKVTGKLGKEFSDLAKVVQIDPAGSGLAADLTQIYTKHEDAFNAAQNSVIMKRLVDDANDAVAKGRAISGSEYQDVRSAVSRAAVAANDPAVKRTLWDMVNRLDDEADKALIAKNPDLGGAFKDLRKRYMTAMALSDTYANFTSDIAKSGTMTPAQFLSTLSNTGRLYSKSATELSQLAEDSVRVLAEPEAKAVEKGGLLGVLNPIPNAGGLGGPAAAAAAVAGTAAHLNPLLTGGAAYGAKVVGDLASQAKQGTIDSIILSKPFRKYVSATEAKVPGTDLSVSSLAGPTIAAAKQLGKERTEQFNTENAVAPALQSIVPPAVDAGKKMIEIVVRGGANSTK